MSLDLDDKFGPLIFCSPAFDLVAHNTRYGWWTVKHTEIRDRLLRQSLKQAIQAMHTENTFQHLTPAREIERIDDRRSTQAKCSIKIF